MEGLFCRNCPGHSWDPKTAWIGWAESADSPTRQMADKAETPPELQRTVKSSLSDLTLCNSTACTTPLYCQNVIYHISQDSISKLSFPFQEIIHVLNRVLFIFIAESILNIQSWQFMLVFTLYLWKSLCWITLVNTLNNCMYGKHFSIIFDFILN